jgi:hypothetical protein
MYNYSPSIIEAFGEWVGKKAYLNNRGSYCTRPYTASPTNHPKGKVATWDKEVKKIFKDCSEFHEAANNYFGMDAMGQKLI